MAKWEPSSWRPPTESAHAQLHGDLLRLSVYRTRDRVDGKDPERFDWDVCAQEISGSTIYAEGVAETLDDGKSAAVAAAKAILAKALLEANEL